MLKLDTKRHTYSTGKWTFWSILSRHIRLRKEKRFNWMVRISGNRHTDICFVASLCSLHLLTRRKRETINKKASQTRGKARKGHSLLGAVPGFFFAQNFRLHKLLEAMMQGKATLVGRGVAVSRRIGILLAEILVLGR